MDEMERKVRFLEDCLLKEKRIIRGETKRDEVSRSLIRASDVEHNTYVFAAEEPAKLKMNDLEHKLDDLEKELQQMNTNQETLSKNLNELIELRHVLQKDQAFFANMAEVDLNIVRAITGVIARSVTNPATGTNSENLWPKFERALWRVTRGNLFMRHAEIDEPFRDPATGDTIKKNVFILFCQGERLEAKVKKICESFGANLYDCPKNPAGRAELLSQVKERLQDVENVLAKTRTHRRQLLADIKVNIVHWRDQVAREKAIYHTMNLFNYDKGRKCLIAEGWCPKNATERIIAAMRTATQTSGALVPSILSVIPSHEEPPTFFRTNRFTEAFQAIVSSYGIAHYREINPAVFAIITFPFLFAVMFGDAGHGIIMVMVAAYMVAKEKKLQATLTDEMALTLFGGRYMILLMGLFSIYTGMLYNEFFSIPLPIFQSQWTFNMPDQLPTNGTVDVVGQLVSDYVYPFGADWGWKSTSNALSYSNSLKMKMSIIFGVLQMTLGIVMHFLNALYFEKIENIIGEFIPQVIFLWGIFGYMCFLIFFKWTIPYSDPSTAPLLLNVMIDMLLSPFSLPDKDFLYEGQHPVQLVLLIAAVICVPVMLCFKPFYLKRKHQSQTHVRIGEALVDTADDQEHEPLHKKESHGGGHGGHGEEFEFGEVMIHQIIHTIEFVLGAISNTASYLRLWALSLAHAQLSEVFWEMVFLRTIKMENAFLVFIGFGAWAGATIGVLLGMESLSAFLHALRLHWVEFQNKFYQGDGKAFLPFSYETILVANKPQAADE